MKKAHATQATIKRILVATEAAGLPIVRFEVTPEGKVIVYTSAEGAAIDGPNDWDKPNKWETHL